MVYNICFLSFGTEIKSSKLLDILNASGNSDRFVMAEEELFGDGVLRKKFETAKKVRDNQEFCKSCEERFEEFLNRLRDIYNKRK